MSFGFYDGMRKAFEKAVRDLVGGEHDGRILFWEYTVGQRPQDFIRHDVEESKRLTLAAILAQGQQAEAYMGYANCRICNAVLGSCDMRLLDFTWPEKAEHYVITHDVWTPGCDALLAAANRREGQR